MELRPYQEYSRKAVEAEWSNGVNRTLLVLPTGCHAKGQKVLKRNGKVAKVETIQQGDVLLGPDGTGRTVLTLHYGVSPLYKITPTKGKPFIVTENHMLSLVQTNTRSCPKFSCQTKGGNLVDVTVKDYLNWSNNKKHIHKLFRASEITSFGNKAELPIDPYFVGILLGDGGLIYSINVTTPEPEIVEVLREQAKKYNMWLKEEAAGKAKTYLFVGGNTGCKGSQLHQDLCALGLRRKGSEDKSVPFDYKTADIEVRLQVIAGLIDTDGSLTLGGYDYISKSKQLSNDLAFMCRSVGLAAYVSACQKSCGTFTGTYYRVSISGDCDKIPCKVKRKQSPPRKQKKNVLRTGFKVEPIGDGEYYGFTVDGDNRYLLDDFTVTHNCGKTIVFSKITEDMVRKGERGLILAHRGELLTQAADKLHKVCGLNCATEKAEETCLGSWDRVAVGSVQSLQREKRLAKFPKDYFGFIVVDEAHHCLSDGYQRVLEHFDQAKVLGVTATPDRGDMKNLGQYFESLAYEYTLPKAIKEGYLVPIKAQTIPLELDISSVGTSSGDFKVGDLGTALDPYLEQIANEMCNYCKERKTVVFLPLIKTSQKFCELLNQKGFRAAEVNGNSDDREQILKDFDNGKYNVLCNSMLLTEGWDCPSVNCIIVLRPTKVRSLYSQMVGRGTRLSPDTGKTDLLLLDFLWHTSRHELCHPANLICDNEETAQKMTKNIEDKEAPIDIMEAEETATNDVVREREEALAKKLSKMKKRKRELVNPLQFEMSIQEADLINYQPHFCAELEPPTPEQIKKLEKFGIYGDEIEFAGKAEKLLQNLYKRADEGLASAKQIRLLENRGFQQVSTWKFEDANKLIGRISANRWQIPRNINPKEYRPGA